MKGPSRTLLFAIALLVAATIASAQQNKAEKLYQQALYEMEGMGNYTTAIQLFNQILTQFPKEKSLGAKALLRIGKCYEKLGNTEARKAYERIVREFADQSSVVKEARARLIALGNGRKPEEKLAMTSRQVWTLPGSGTIHGTASHDGRYLPYTDWTVNGELFLHDIVSGASRRVTRDVEKFGQFQFAEAVTFSPDDAQLAYAWFNKDHYELRVIGLQTPGVARPRVLFSNPEVSRILPEDWSTDGKWLAVQLRKKDKTAQIGLIAVHDGSLRILKSVDWRGSSNLFFSSDSRYLAYDLPTTDTGNRRDVFVLAIDGSREMPAVVHPSNDVLMGWSPDGRRLLFTSDRTGSTGLWSLAFVNGKPEGTPEQIKVDFTGASMGVSSKGTLYSSIRYPSFTGVIRSDIQVAAFDFAKGQFLSTPALAVQTSVGANNFPAWSPDGKHLAFLSRRGEMVQGQNTVIGILSQGTGQLRELRPELNVYVGGAPLRWSPDGLSLAITATDFKGRQGVFRIDATTEEATPIALSSRGPVGEGESFTNPLWAPDGEKIYYNRIVRSPSAGSFAVIVERELSSGNEKEIIRRSRGASWNPYWMFVDLSPDGKYLAAVENDAWPGHVTGKWNVLLIPASGGEPKELMRGESQGAGVLMWAPDSRSIFVYSMKDGLTRDREVWRVAIDGTESQKLSLNVNSLGPPFNSDQQLHAHPDGKRVAFAATEPAKPGEVWALENFLPKEEKEASNQKSTKLLLSGTGWEGSGAISPDESKIAFVDYSSNWGDLIVKDPRTGATETLIDARGYYKEFAGYPLWSPDGKQIAYYWYLNKDPWFDLRVVSSNGGEPKVLSANRELTLFPRDWSPDGKSIVCELLKADKSVALGVVMVPSGEVRQLVSLEWNRLGDARFSPNGKFIVYDIAKEGNRDLHVLSVDGKQATRLTDSPGEDSNPAWSPDGKYIVFSSNRRGTWDLWGIAMRDGNPVAQPFLVQSDLGNHRKRITTSGKMFYNASNDLSDVFYVELNPHTGEMLGQPKLITKSFYGQHRIPAWAPDGKRIAYIRTSGPSTLCILSIPDGKEECIETGMRYFNRLFWSPDGKSLALSPAGKTGKNGVYLFSLDTRELRPIIELSDFRPKGWSADGKEFILVKPVWNAQQSQVESQKLISVDIATGKEKSLVDTIGMGESNRNDFFPSPDQKRIVFVERDSTVKEQKLVVSDLSLVTRRVLATVKEPSNSFDTPRWSPDGTKIAYNLMTQVGGALRTELRIVSADGTWERKIETGKSVGNWTPASWSPDGRKLAITLNEETINELWVMENFLSKEEKEPSLTVRKVSPGAYFDIMGAPSPDGQFLTYVDWDTGDLAVYELATGRKRHVTNKGSWSESSEFAEFSIVSPDGKQIAYAWRNKDESYDLRVIGSDGSHPHVLYHNEEVGFFKPSDWSADGKQILTVLFRNDNTNQIALISATDGSARVLKTLGWSYPGKMSLSPDGRYIIYDFPQKEDATERDISILAADGSREVPLIQHPADDKVLGWTPDGNYVLFDSDRTGTMCAWAIRVADGKPHGAPEIIKSDIGRIFPLGFTRNGNFYYGLLTGMHDAYIATLDLAAGKVVAPPKAIAERSVGSTTAPTWSPDGKFIAYILRQTVMFGFSPSAIVIRSLESGEERKISPAMAYLNSLRWSPDGRVILVSGRDKKGRRGIFQIDVQTGGTSPIVTGEVNQPLWSPDGKSILYVKSEQTTKTDRIMIRDIGTNEEKELYRSVEPYQVAALTISPDGKRLAFCLSGAVSSTRLMVMPTIGGVPRELLQLKDPERIPTGFHGVVEWVEGGRKILFVKRGGEAEGMELWDIPAESGKAQNLGIRMELLHGLRVHPDGKQIAFAGGQNKTEVWVMENFLSRSVDSAH